MKTLALIALLLVPLVAPAYAQYLSCGIPPIPPLGCSRDRMRCICDGQGNCQWVFDCTRY